jgi:hypothetical protein
MLCEDGCLLIFQDGVLSTARKDRDSKCDIKNVEISKTIIADTDSGKHENMENGTTEPKNRKEEKEDERSRMSIDVDGTFRSTYTDDETFVSSPSGDCASPPNTVPEHPTQEAPSPSKLRDLSLTVDIPLDNTPISDLENGGQNPLPDPISPRWPSHFSVGVRHAMAPTSFVLGTWDVRIESQIVAVETVGGSSGKKGKGLEHVRTLQSVRTLLDGNFHYHLLVPSYCTHLTVPALTIESGSSSHGSTKTDREVSLSVFVSKRLTRYLPVKCNV